MVAVSCYQSKAESRLETKPYAVVLSGDTISYTRLGHVDGTSLIVDKDVNMHGGLTKLPMGITLHFKGGMICNGALEGCDTEIEGRGTIFDKVKIKGCWNVPKISTKMFADLSYVNALRDVVALASPKVKNSITIEEGDYWMKSEKKGDVGLLLCSHTELVLKGTIRLVPNGYKSYYIVRAKGENVRIGGGGAIIGDKPTHTGTTGEWGMGIDLRGTVNATIKGLTIKDCWGDCIYVSGRSKNVLIEGCTLDNGRRQGISVTNADGVTIRDCVISNVSGTNPQFAIDIEPNRRDSVNDIHIENVTVRNCEGGILVTRGKPQDGAKTPWIGAVSITNCQVASKSKRPVSIKRCEEVKIEKCSLNAQNGRSAIFVTETEKAIVRNNKVSIDGNIIKKVINNAKNIVSKNVLPIHVKTTGQKLVKNNQIVKR